MKKEINIVSRETGKVEKNVIPIIKTKLQDYGMVAVAIVDMQNGKANTFREAKKIYEEAKKNGQIK